jgi:hypothetical protein
MDHIFFNLPCVFIYLDDTCKLQATPLRITACMCGRCSRGQRTVEFLGHKVSAASISPLPDKVVALQSFPEPATIE